MLAHGGSFSLAAYDSGDADYAVLNLQAALQDLDKVFAGVQQRAPLGSVRTPHTLSRNNSSHSLGRENSNGTLLPQKSCLSSGERSQRQKVCAAAVEQATASASPIDKSSSGTHLPTLETGYTIASSASASDGSTVVSCQASSTSASTSQSSDSTVVEQVVASVAAMTITSKPLHQHKVQSAQAKVMIGTSGPSHPHTSPDLARSPAGRGWSMHKSFTKVVVTSFADLTWSEQVKVSTCDVPQLLSIKVLGRGTYGVVEAVEVPVSLGKTFIAARKHCTDQNQVAFLNESNALMACRDMPFIIQLYQDHEEETPTGIEHYSLMELARYGNLAQVISALCDARAQARKVDKEPIMPEAKVRYYAACLISALETLEARQIAHRDIKSENVLVGDKGVPKLADFGLATQLPGPGEHLTDIAGTLHYLAPEAFQHRTSRASDWWSLGILLLELTVGLISRRAVHRLRCRKYQWPSYISPALKDLLSQLLEPSPKRRLQLSSEAMTHPFFKGLDWESLPQKSGPYTAPDVLAGRRK